MELLYNPIMSLVFETVDGRPFDVIHWKGEKRRRCINEIFDGRLELVAAALLGKRASSEDVVVSFYQDGGEGREIRAPRVEFVVVQSVVVIEGHKGELLLGIERLRIDESVMVFVKHRSNSLAFVARNK